METPSLAPRLTRLPTVAVLGHEVRLAVGPRARLLGLALLSGEEAGAGLLIPRCSSVHTFGMRFALDVYFLDDRRAVVGVSREVAPCRVISQSCADAVLEVPSSPTAGR